MLRKVLASRRWRWLSDHVCCCAGRGVLVSWSARESLFTCRTTKTNIHKCLTDERDRDVCRWRSQLLVSRIVSFAVSRQWLVTPRWIVDGVIAVLSGPRWGRNNTSLRLSCLIKDHRQPPKSQSHKDTTIPNLTTNVRHLSTVRIRRKVQYTTCSWLTKEGEQACCRARRGLAAVPPACLLTELIH